MSITVKSKQELINRIIHNQVGMQLEKDVLEIVKQFEHRKRVDKTFLEALEAKGYDAYIFKDKWSSKLVVRKRIESEDYKSSGGYSCVEFSIYHSEISEKRPFTWKGIVGEFVRYGYEKCLKDAQEALKCADDELTLFENFVKDVEQQNFKCFDLWGIKRDLEEALSAFKSNKVS